MVTANKSMSGGFFHVIFNSPLFPVLATKKSVGVRGPNLFAVHVKADEVEKVSVLPLATSPSDGPSLSLLKNTPSSPLSYSPFPFASERRGMAKRTVVLAVAELDVSIVA